MGLDWQSLLVQLPLVAAVIWFVLEIDKRGARSEEVRDAQWRCFLKDQQQAYTKSLEDQRLAFAQSMAEQRVAFSQSLAEVSTSLNKLNDSFDVHDDDMAQAITRMETVTQTRGVTPRARKKKVS